jgi:hypothetical protein
MKYGSLDFYQLPFYLKSPTIIRLFLSLACTAVQAFRYWPAWHPVDAGISEFGLAENDIVEHRDDVSNLSVVELFSSDSISCWLRNWNHSAHIFWKRYLFYPLKDSGWPYQAAHHSTFVASAIWHGWEPVYFLCLPEMAAAVIADELLLRFVDVGKLSPPLRALYGLWVVTAMFTAVSTFWYRSFAAFWFVRRSNRYCGTVVIIAMLAIMLAYTSIAKKKRRAGEKKTD